MNSKIKLNKKVGIMLLVGGLILLLSSCYIPNPLYGTWADGNGREKIIFMDDGTFTATILNSDDTTTDYTGEWSTVDNILILNIKGAKNYSRNAPWDLQGAILHLTWTSDTQTRILTLYHIAR